MKSLLHIILFFVLFYSKASSQHYFDGTSLTEATLPPTFMAMLGISQSQNVLPNKRFSYQYDPTSVNTGTSGACMEKKPATYKGLINVQSGFEKIARLPQATGTDKKYFVEYGGNDILYGAPYSTAEFTKAYNSYITKLLSLGWQKWQIVVFANYQFSPSALQFYKARLGITVPDKNRIDKYNAAIEAVIKKFGLSRFDLGKVLSSIPVQDKPKIFMTDSLHPTGLGDTYIANSLIAQFKTPMISMTTEKLNPPDATQQADDDMTLAENTRLVTRRRAIKVKHG